MIRVASRRVARTDYWLVLVVLALVVLGLVMVYSASYHFPFVSEKYEAQPPNYFLRRQIIFALVGLAGMVILARVDYQLYRRFAVLILVATVVILVVMAPLGRWLLRSQRSVQPAELAKVGVMIYMSVWLASKGEEIRHLTLGLMPFALLLMFLCVLVVLQPDFSTAALLVATASAMLLVAGADVRGLLVWLLFVCAVLMPVSVIAPYVFIRIRSWLGSPLRASVGEGFQLMQSLGWGRASRNSPSMLPTPIAYSRLSAKSWASWGLASLSHSMAFGRGAAFGSPGMPRMPTECCWPWESWLGSHFRRLCTSGHSPTRCL